MAEIRQPKFRSSAKNSTEYPSHGRRLYRGVWLDHWTDAGEAEFMSRNGMGGEGREGENRRRYVYPKDTRIAHRVSKVVNTVAPQIGHSSGYQERHSSRSSPATVWNGGLYTVVGSTDC